MTHLTEVKTPARVVAVVVEELEELLAAAREGKVLAFSYAAIEKEGGPQYGWCGIDGETQVPAERLLGGTTLLHARLTNTILESAEETDGYAR